MSLDTLWKKLCFKKGVWFFTPLPAPPPPPGLAKDHTFSHFFFWTLPLLALVIIAMVKVMKICRNDKCKDQTTLNSVLLSLIRKSHHMEFSIMQKSFSCQTQLTKHLKQGSPVKLMVICVPKVPAAPLQHRKCVPGMFTNITFYTQILFQIE